MIDEFQLRNFKAWEDTGPMTLKPLTVIFGTNSSGKSSLGVCAAGATFWHNT